MVTMNPYYAYPSSVGPVFAVGKWSGWRCVKMGVIVAVVGIGALLATGFMYDPTLMLGKPKQEPFKGLVKETVSAQKKYPWRMRAGTAATALIGWFCTAAATATFRNVRGDYFLRVGPGGISLRLPNGLDFSQLGFGSKVVSLEVPWNQVRNLTVTSHKQIGSLSRNAGNIGSSVRLWLTSGAEFGFDTSMLSLPGYLVHQRIQEAREMVVGNLDFDDQVAEEPVAV